MTTPDLATPAGDGCHSAADLDRAARSAGQSELLDQYARDYPQGPHDKPQSMCPAFGSLRVGLRMKRVATVLSGSACCVYGLTFVSHFYGARRSVGYVPFDSESLVTGKLFEDIREAVLALGGADVVYDAVGGDQFTAAFRSARPEARILTIGFASGEVPQIKANHLLVKNLTVMGLYWGGYLTFRPEALTGSLATLFGCYAEGRIKPHISHVLPLDRAMEGMELLRARASTGKVVIQIPG